MRYNFAAWSIPFSISLSGDTETNPGPKPIAGQRFSICHWNLNSILVHNFTKISVLTAYVLVHDFDIICLSETCLNSENNKRGDVLKLNLDALLCGNLFLTVMIGDFNAKFKDWCSIDITSFEGSELDFLTSQFGLSQIIKEPTHILDNSRSCIDVIFTSQPNMVIDSGVHASLHANCHHQIIYAKFDLKIIYPPPYERTVWHFKHANSDHIKRAIDIFDWESALNYIDANDQVSVFDSTILNIVSNFISNETIACDDRGPPRMNYKKPYPR